MKVKRKALVLVALLVVLALPVGWLIWDSLHGWSPDLETIDRWTEVAIDAFLTVTICALAVASVIVCALTVALAAVLVFRRRPAGYGGGARRRLSLQDCLRVLRRRKWALLVPTVIGMVLAAAVAAVAGNPALAPWLLPARYRAVALVRRRDLTVTQDTPSTLISPQPAVLSLDVFRQEILTWDNLDRVIRQTGLDGGLATARDWQDRYEGLRGAITIRSAAQSRGVDLIEIAVADTKPAIAARIANAIADNYVEQSKKSLRSDTRAVVSFLEKGREEYLAKLGEVQARLADYQEKHFADLPDVREGIWSKLLDLRVEVEAQRLQLMEAERSLAQATRALEGVPETAALEPAPAPLQDRHEPVAQPGHPVVQPNPTYRALDAKRADLEREVKGRQKALFDLNSQISARERELEKMAGDQKGYLEIQQDIDEVTKIYDTYRTNLVAARTRLEVDAGEYGTQVEMVSRALEPAIPYWRACDKLAALCIVGGLLIGVVLVLCLESLDTSFRSREDAAAFLGVPVLASLSTSARPSKAYVSEVHMLRNRLLAAKDGERPRVLTVTSSDRGKGKTTLALDLAVALSETGAGRVVVLDGDLLRPHLYALVDVEPSAGLIEALQGDLDLEGKVYPTQTPGVDIIPSLALKDLSTVEPLIHQRFPAMIEKLKGLYAYVIIDAPPVLEASQTGTFAAQSDGALLTVQLERTKREVAKHAADELVHGGANLLGCVLTDRRRGLPSFV